MTEWRLGVDENYVVVIVSRLRWDCNGRLMQNRGAGEAFSLGEKVARSAPDEGEMSGSFPLISHLR